MESKSVTLPSDDEGDETCMPKIINTISLQGVSGVSFKEEPDNDDAQGVLYPECEIKEENTGNEDIKPEPVENGLPHRSTDKEEKVKKEKKRLNLTSLPRIKHEKEPQVRASTSRKEDVVDAKRIALQESLFKSKELFDTFLRVCQDSENTDEMNKVVEKMSRAYALTRPEYLGTPTFQNILEAETEKVNTSSSKPWLNMKLVLDELKFNKKGASTKPKLGESEESQDAGGSNDDEPVIECPKKRRHLKKLEKFLRAINLKIKKLEEREVDWDDEDNSAYCKLDRYRAQFTKIYTKICEIKGKLPDADRPYLRKVSFAGRCTTYPHINRCIEKYYNKHREFPDFQDIKKLVILALKQEGIEMPPIKIHSMAAAAFKEFGEMLKRLRQYDDYDVLCSYLDQQVDPARNDEELQEQLAMNALLFKKREQEVIDKFVEKESTRGVGSGSGDDSDSKPKKKKRKIVITNPNSKKTHSSPTKPNLSSSESSDEENYQSKPNSRFGLSSDSDNSESDSEVKKHSVKSKGKSLIGKQRIVKKGVKKSPNKSQMPKTAISSDEESAPGNTKESLTNYLGLKGKSSPKSSATKESNKISESEDEVTYVNEVKKLPERSRNALSDSSDSDKATKTKSPVQSERTPQTNSRRDTKDSKDAKTKVNTISDSDCEIEPVAVIKKPKQSNQANVRKPKNQARKSTAPLTHKTVPKKHIVNTNQNNAHETISDSDSSASEGRTSDEGSESDEKKLSEVELSADSKSDSSDIEQVIDEKPNMDEPIVILSEDVIEEPKPKPPVPKKTLSKPHEDSSDSDDICILSQEGERRTVAPRKLKPNSPAVASSAQRKTANATSTPNKSAKLLMKRRLSNQSNNGSSTKARKLDVTTNGRGRQSTLPQMINGAARKVSIYKVPKSGSSSGSSTPTPIPLIELD